VHAGDRDTPDQFHSAVNLLRSVERIETPYIGFSATPARRRFYKLSKVCVTYGKEEDFKDLLGDRNPMVRAMGLACLVQVDPEAHEEVLRNYIADAGRIGMLEGCVASKITVGELVRRLIEDPEYLEFKQWRVRAKKRIAADRSDAPPDNPPPSAMTGRQPLG
jgi:hypothetical protein